MIVASLLLVIVAAVTLVIGLFNPENATWVWASIACCVVAGLLLIVGVLRARPRRKPVLQSGTDQPASWAGASSWATVDPATGAVVDRESAQGEGVRVVDEPAPASADAGPAAAQADDAAVWAPAEPAGKEATPAAPMPAASDDAATGEIAPPAPSDGGDEQPAAPAPRKATGAVAAGAQSDAERINAALSGIAGVGPAKRKALIAEFPTYRKLRAASVDKLAGVPGVSKTLAERIHTALHS